MRRFRTHARACLATGVSVALAAGVACGAAEAPPPETANPAVAAAAAALPEETPRPRRGLWVLCEGSQRVLEHPERIDALLADAGDLGVTDLFVQVYRGGRAWFDSTHADATPYRRIRAEIGADTLARLIDRAHGAGLRVHAWVNALSLAGNRDAPPVRELGRDAVLVDRHGRSILDYPELEVPQPDRRYYRMGTRAVWLDPAAPGVAEHLVATFAELLERYPQLDGLHLDYIRYPDVLPFVPGSRFGVGLDFGYGPRTRARFTAETGLGAPFGKSMRNANRWDAWRRDKVTAIVAAIDAAARARTPRAQLSAAVWTYADRAYLAQGQDWRGWLDAGLLDFAVPMAYTRDTVLFGYLTESFAGRRDRQRIWLGVGAWLFAKQPERAIEQLRIARASGVGGDVLFSWDAIADSPALRAALAAEVRGAP